MIDHPARAGGHLGVAGVADMGNERFAFDRILDELKDLYASRGIARKDAPLIVTGGANSHEAVRKRSNAGAERRARWTAVCCDGSGRCAS